MERDPFEFRHRLAIIVLIYVIGFACSSFDHVNAAAALARLITHWRPRWGIEFAYYPERVIFMLAGLLVLAAAATRTWAAAYLKSTIVHDERLHSERIVADGPYRYVRNPLYLGSALLGAGLGFLASRLGGVIIVLGSLVLYWRLATVEEANLLRDQGEPYRAYCLAVPRFFPAVSPRVPASGARPEWGQAFCGELMMWLFAAGILGLALTLRRGVAVSLIDAGLAVYAIDRILQWRKERAIP